MKPFLDSFVENPFLLNDYFSEHRFNFYEKGVDVKPDFGVAENYLFFDKNKGFCLINFEYEKDIFISILEKLFPEPSNYTAKNLSSILYFHEQIFSKIGLNGNTSCCITSFNGTLSFKTPLISFSYVNGLVKTLRLTNEFFYKYDGIESLTLDNLYSFVFSNFKYAFSKYLKNDEIIVTNNTVSNIVNNTPFEYFERTYANKNFKLVSDQYFLGLLTNFPYPITSILTDTKKTVIREKELCIIDDNQENVEGFLINNFEGHIKNRIFIDLKCNSNDSFILKYLFKDIFGETELSYFISILSLMKFYDTIFLSGHSIMSLKKSISDRINYNDGGSSFNLEKYLQITRLNYSKNVSPHDEDAYSFRLSDFTLNLGQTNKLQLNDVIISEADNFVDMYNDLSALIIKKTVDTVSDDSCNINITHLDLIEILTD